MTTAPELTKCPICDSLDTLLVRSIDVEQLIEAWKQKFDIDVSSEFRKVKTVDLLGCDCCYVQFFVPDCLTGSGHIYAQLQRFDWYHIPRRWEYNIALGDLRECGRILEIGCGVGDFIKQARNEEGLNVEGIELDDDAVRKAQESYLPVRALNLEDLAVSLPGHYDAVCGFQVLEHVPNPKKFLECSCALIKPGGKLLLGLPNAESFLKYQFNILDMPPHHMTRWSSSVLNHLQKFFPLNLEHVKLEPLAEYHVNGYVTAYCFALAKYSFVQNLCRYRPRQLISKFIKSTGIRRLLTGQSMYASFTRI